MSVTAFNRRRRELAKLQEQQNQEQAKQEQGKEKTAKPTAKKGRGGERA